jgi:hypothetical protein
MFGAAKADRVRSDCEALQRNLGDEHGFLALMAHFISVQEA